MEVKKTAASLLSMLVLASIGPIIHADPAGPGGAPDTAVQPAPAPTTPKAPAGLLLRLKFKKGEVFVYRMTTTLSGSMTQGGRVIPMNTSTSMVMDQKVKSVRADGAARLIVSMGSAVMTVQGRTIPMNAQIRSMLTGNSMVMDTHGSIVTMDVNSSNPMASMFSSSSGSGFLSGYAFPDGAVNIGDTWTKPYSIPAMGLNATNTYSLANSWLQNGKQFVAIHSSASGNISMQPNSQSQMAMNMSGPITTTSDIILDNTSGIVRQVKGSSHTQMSVNMTIPSQQGGPGTPQTMTNDMTTSTTLQLVRVEQH